ncbi:maleylacetate reductase [Rhizobium sp. TRM95111]|uniref:maleylacetate reductase n=1 Tax=Rhizobium alarense TaxID=2846851 RepID=UPI001F16D038|nr:maleylacetate reductase [Rhizobium alarense]MCF3639814.1 maleylacetate reductase [Rhizobium alarense]
MMRAFDYQGSSAKILFGAGARTRVAETVAALDCKRALVLSTPQQADDAGVIVALLADRAAGLFTHAAMHTPVEITERALQAMRDTGADCTVAFGGGSTTGLGKAVAYHLDTPQVVIPTTYAGSEVTPILGQTQAHRKETVRTASVLPEAVIYDPELTLGLPVPMTMTSGLNGMAHAAEALYARDRNPVSSLMAAEGLKALADALPRIAEAPHNLSARSGALYGAWLCGTVLGAVDMSLHHKLCHVLGGSFDLPHAETHAIVLPHAVAFNSSSAASELRPITEIFGGSAPGVALHDFAVGLGVPTALKDIGLQEEDLDRAADIATANPYWNPREVTRADIRALLAAAWRGDPPTH